MSKHVQSWLPAYHDGELKGAQLTRVQTHLEDCEECRQALDELSGLSAFLQESPPAKPPTPTAQFAAQVALRMPRRPQEPTWRKALRWGWQLAPSALGLVWAFTLTTSVISNLITGTELLIDKPLLSDPLTSLSPENPWQVSLLPSVDGINDAVRLMWDAAGLGAYLDVNIIFGLLVPLVLGLLAISWVIGWWITQENGKSNGHA